MKEELQAAINVVEHEAKNLIKVNNYSHLLPQDR